MKPETAVFSNIARDSEGENRTIKITRGDAGPIHLTMQPVTHNNIEAQLKEITAGEEYELDVRLKPPWPNNTISTYLKLETGIEEVPSEQIRVYGRISPRLRAVPSRFQIPQKVDRDLTPKVRLDWSGKTPGKVTDITVTDKNLTASLEESASGEQFIVLHVPADYSASNTRVGFVNVMTDDPAIPRLRIQVMRSRAISKKPNPNVRRSTVTPTGIQRSPATAKPGEVLSRKKPADDANKPPARKPVEHPAQSDDPKPEKPSDS